MVYSIPELQHPASSSDDRCSGNCLLLVVLGGCFLQLETLPPGERREDQKTQRVNKT